MVNNLQLNQEYNIAYIRNGELFSSDISIHCAENELTNLIMIDDNKMKSWAKVI